MHANDIALAALREHYNQPTGWLGDLLQRWAIDFPEAGGVDALGGDEWKEYWTDTDLSGGGEPTSWDGIEGGTPSVLGSDVLDGGTPSVVGSDNITGGTP